MTNPRFFRYLIILSLFAISGSAFASFEDGLKAFENQNYQVAYQEWLPLAEQGHPEAQFYIGLMHYYALEADYDLVETLKWYRRAAEQGLADAQNGLGSLYEYGEGVGQSYEKAAQWYQKAAEQDDMYGYANLGYLYLDGLGVLQDEAKALELFQKAAELGDEISQYNLGYFYFSGTGVEKDVETALEWYRKSAENGYADAQLILGYIYRDGNAGKVDFPKAIKWLTRAAEQGLAGAQNDLGMMYANGQGVKKDMAEAAKWYAMAAEQGLAASQYSLGMFHMYGISVEKDLELAKYWLSLSARQEDPDAQNLLALIEAYEQEPIENSAIPIQPTVSEVEALIPRGFFIAWWATEQYVDPDITRIMTQLSLAFRHNTGETLDTVLESKDGEALPYQEWYGITKEEYRRVLNPVWKYELANRGSVHVEEVSENVFTISGGDFAPGLEVSVDLNKMTVQTPFGTLEEVRQFDSDSRMYGQGPEREGYTWTKLDFPTRITFALAKLHDSDQRLMFYHINTNGNPVSRSQRYTLIFD